VIRALLIDLDGVVYEADALVRGAREALAAIEARGIRSIFLTNTTSRPRSALVDKLRAFGIDISPQAILTPPVAAVRWIASHAAEPVALCVPPATATEFQLLEVAPGEADTRIGTVVIGDYAERWSFAELNRAFRLLMVDPPPVLAALGMTRYWRASDGLRLDTAPFVKALEHATGIEPVVLGKPGAAFFETALAALGASAEDALMIGDDIHTDVDGAQRCGIRGLLVKTGKFRAADLALGIEPLAVLDSIADLPGWLADHGVAPDDKE
jgi:phospholysine phosphohistidine inorganic pyrophosphate phosphatase